MLFGFVCHMLATPQLSRSLFAAGPCMLPGGCDTANHRLASVQPWPASLPSALALPRQLQAGHSCGGTAPAERLAQLPQGDGERAAPSLRVAVKLDAIRLNGAGSRAPRP